MKIFLTGGSGYIGSLLCSSLVEAGFDVTSLSRKERYDSKFATVVGDLTADTGRLSDLIAQSDVIYHCAGELLNKHLMYDLHVRGTANLLSAVRERITRTGKAIHWVQLSSTGAYSGYRQTANEAYVSENNDPNPIGLYEITKTISDELVKGFALTEPLFTYTIIRPSIVIGPTMRNQSFWEMARFIKNGWFFYIGSKEAVATYVHVDDVVRALQLCGVGRRSRNETFIVSNDCLYVDLVNAVSSALGVRRPWLRVPERFLRFILHLTSPFVKLPLTVERVDAVANRTSFCSSRIMEVLDFRCEYSIPEVMPKLLAGLNEGKN